MSNESNSYRSDLSNQFEGNRFWTDKALGELGQAILFFHAINIGFIAFIVHMEGGPRDIAFAGSWAVIVSIVLGLISVLSSTIAVISRVHDMRLTRHLVWTRVRNWKRGGCELPDDFINLNDKNLFDLLKNFRTTIFSNTYFIDDDTLKDENKLKIAVTKLKTRNLMLGRLTWMAFYFHIIFMFMSFIFYVADVVINSSVNVCNH